MWLCDAKPQDSIVRIGQKLKKRLGIDDKTIIGYEVHSDTMAKQGSMAKVRYTV
jgi:hypothetical protein